MSCINDFWNKIGAMQIATGNAPSVRTKEIKEYEAGKKSLDNVSKTVLKDTRDYLRDKANGKF